MAARHAIAIDSFPQASKLAPAPPQGELRIGQYDNYLPDHNPALILLYCPRSYYFIYEQMTLGVTVLGGDAAPFLKLNIETYAKNIESYVDSISLS